MTLNAIPDDRQLALAPPTLRPSIREDEIRAVLAKSDAGRSGPPRGAMRLAKEIADMSRATQEMQTAMRMMAIGVDYRQFDHFKRLTPSILYFIDGHTERRAPDSYAPTLPEFDDCRQFIITVALRIAELGPHIQPNSLEK